MKRDIFCLFSLILISLFFCSSVCGEEIAFQAVIDGDTIRVGHEKKVRLIGIDAPETYEGHKMTWKSRQWKMELQEIRRLGDASKDFLFGLITACAGRKKVLLRYDRNNVYSSHMDKYKRKLAYVYLPVKKGITENPDYVYDTINGERYIFLNASIVRAGYAFVYIFADYEFKSFFLSLEKEAREKGKGLWSGEKGFLYIWPFLEKERRDVLN